MNIILGGARSGKSALAERLIRADGRSRTYIATAQAFDDEMEHRIAAHRHDRGSDWTTVEEPIALCLALREAESRMKDGVVLIDCLTLWLTNILLDERNTELECNALLDTLRALTVPVVCVSNELGMGLVPENKLGRMFRDAQGRLNQRIAQEADLAIFAVAGLPMVLKGTLPEHFA